MMQIVSDLHIHSSYSRATSSRLTPPWLERWARIKGITLLGTGDCTHPQWLSELRDQLDDVGDGFYALKKEIRETFDAGPAMADGLPHGGEENPLFVLTGEIATIYKYGDKTRKIHHLIILPDFKAAAAFNVRLEALGGNIRSDGRPILGMDSRDLLALLLETDERALLIPAHIWTPWFSVLGEKSGFDSIEECYRDMAGYISAVETGLSSNPPMNWALGSLDKFSIISNSDAHSPDKLGREATILLMELSYTSLKHALSSGSQGIAGTIEFFPQEGKYHYDGHRKCAFSAGPEEAAAGNFLCPVCGKPLTRGVMGRVLSLADRPVNEEQPYTPESGGNRRPYHSLIPLRELCAELLGIGAASKKVENAYYHLIDKGGTEFSILMDMGPADLEKLTIPELSGEILAEAIGRMRAGNVSVEPGYDGEYGKIRVYASAPGPGEPNSGTDLFGALPPKAAAVKRERAAPQDPIRVKKPEKIMPPEDGKPSFVPDFTPNAEQERVISYNGNAAIIVAGPGTGKTRVLTERIARIIREGADPASILALTFTVKAAAELRERIGPSQKTVKAMTFHSFCCAVLREQYASAGLSQDFKIIGEQDRDSLLHEIGGKQARALGRYIEERKRFLLLPGEEFPKLTGTKLLPSELALTPEFQTRHPVDTEMEALYTEYRKKLRNTRSLDFEDLSAGTVRLLARYPEILELYRQRFRHIFVDEYQDINFSQYLLIRLLASGGSARSLWVIGDPNQAIYGFRGSDKRFIDRFISDYPAAGHFALSKSFRCSEPIVNAASRLTGTELEGRDGDELSLYRTPYATDKSEAEGIARTIAALIGGTSFFAMDSGAAGESSSKNCSIGPADCAILVRTAALSAPIVKALKDHGIPFEITSEPWWKSKPTEMILDKLRRLAPRPASSTVELVRAAKNEIGESAKSEKKGNKKKKPDEAAERLIELAAFFDDLPSFLDTLDVCAASGTPESVTRNDAVKVMTMHASKGLEFEHVFVAGLEEGLLPFTLYDKYGGAEQIEEERRLLYVAMTRAKQGLWLSWAESRTYRGLKLKGIPSRFLLGLEKIIPLRQEDKPRKKEIQPGLF